jgi:hypothetical protein
VREHAVGELAAKLEQAGSFRRFRQPGTRPDRLPAREKNRREPVELAPQRFLGGSGGIDIGGKRRRNAELGRAAILRNFEIPRQRAPDCGILPNSQ